MEQLVAGVILQSHRMMSIDDGSAIFLETLKEYKDTWHLSFVQFILEGKAETDLDYLILEAVCGNTNWDEVTSILTDALERIVRPSDAINEYDARNDAPKGY